MTRRWQPAAKAEGWRVIVCDRDSLPAQCDELVLYVSTELAMAAARKLDVGLIEPPLDLLAQVPDRFLRRTVEFARFADLDRLSRAAFVKPPIRSTSGSTRESIRQPG